MLSGCGDKATNASEEVKGTAVEVLNIVPSEIAVENRLNGRVVSENDVSIYSPISGEVKAVNVKVGDAVKQGDLLAKSGSNKLENEKENCLHFEVYLEGNIINPEELFDLDLTK